MSLMDAYDAALFDLDGVVYLGPEPIPGAAEGLAELRRQEVRVGFVTNNAARAPQTVVEHLRSLGIQAEVEDVVTSAQAIARLMAEQLPAGSAVLVTGTSALADEVRAVGLQVVDSDDAHPAAVVQGYDPQMTMPRLEQACHAIQHGAAWYVSNTDSTRPTDKGLVPGAGALMGVVATAVSATPQIAGKPYAPLMEETVRRLGAERPLFVGDRIDTDIQGAAGVGMDSLLVFTGAHGKRDLVAAPEGSRPTHIGYDLGALQQPARTVTLADGWATCGMSTARLEGDAIRLEDVPSQREGQLDALWAVVSLVWASGADATECLERLDQLP